MTMDASLAAVIVHDIKNALGVLEGQLQQMTVVQTTQDAQQAYRSCVALRERLVAFLTLYKASSQGLNPRIVAASPEDFLRMVLRDHMTTRPELEIALDLSQAPLVGFFDEHLVGLALEAALQNAARFARTRIEIGCSGGADAPLCYTVRDDGPGPGTVESVRSTGLGMELCAAIAQAHRKGGASGSARLESDPRGGALFMLQLP